MVKAVGEAKMMEAAQSKPCQGAEEGGGGMVLRLLTAKAMEPLTLAKHPPPHMVLRLLTRTRACQAPVPKAVPEDEDAGAEGRLMVEAARGLMVVL